MQEEDNKLNEVRFCAVFGMITVLDFKFIITVDQIEKAACLCKHDIWRIRKVSFHPLDNKEYLESINQMEELFKKITGIRKLLTSGFYFSYDYDLTLRN